METGKIFAVALFAILSILATPSAQEDGAGPPPPGQGATGAGAAGGAGDQSLGSQATDPTASLTTYNFVEVWTVNYRDQDRMGYTFRLRPVMPFKLWGVGNILRITIPFDHGGLPGYGLGDVQIFDLLVFPAFGGICSTPMTGKRGSGSASRWACRWG